MSLPRTVDPQERIAELEEEVAYLKSELGMSVKRSQIARVTRAFHLRPGEGRLLARLHAANGHSMPWWVLLEEEGSDNRKLIDVYVCRLRKAIGKDKVLTDWGQGFSLSAEGVALVDGVLGS